MSRLSRVSFTLLLVISCVAPVWADPLGDEIASMNIDVHRRHFIPKWICPYRGDTTDRQKQSNRHHKGGSASLADLSTHSARRRGGVNLRHLWHYH